MTSPRSQPPGPTSEPSLLGSVLWGVLALIAVIFTHGGRKLGRYRGDGLQGPLR